MTSNYSTRPSGRPNTPQYRIYILRDGVPISPFHDVPLFVDSAKSILNMVVEIPRWTNSKLEISRDELLNPILQDTKDGEIRYVRNSYPFHGYIWNYGALPQTWEDPQQVHPDTNAKGDNDPLDACEIGERVGKPGQVKQVKVLGILALLDGSETDWKAIVIDINDPLAVKLDDIADVETYFPGLLDGTRRWFKSYKVPDGKPENELALGGEFRDREYAMNVIDGACRAWQKLTMGHVDPGTISLTNMTVEGSPKRVNPGDLKLSLATPNLEPAPIDPSFEKWFFRGL